MAGVMIQSAFLVIAILIVQKLLGDKLHAYVRYGLWTLVALRLLIPVNIIESPFSMLSAAKGIQLSDAAQQSTDLLKADSGEQEDISNGQDMSLENVLQSTNAGIDMGSAAPMGSTENTASYAAYIGETVNKPPNYTLQADDEHRKESDTARRINISRIQSVVSEFYLSGIIQRVRYGIWFAGSFLVGAFLGISHFRFCRRLRKTREIYTKKIPGAVKKTRLPVYRVKGLETPCLVGLVRPAIYIGTDIDTLSDHFRYTIVHEGVHYQHWDHIWSVLRAVLVVVYWFHPFVWIAAVCSARDGEIACDYGTVRRLGKEERLAYGEMLLALSQMKSRKRVYSYGTMLRPSKSELKERILRLTKTSGNRAWAGILAAMLMVIIAGCALTGAPDVNDSNAMLLVNEAGKNSEDLTSVDNDSMTTDNGDIQDENRESDEKENIPDDEDTDMMEPRQLEAMQAEISGDTLCGVDGPWLDYAGGMGTAGGAKIIFHDYFGLIVYDWDKRDITRSLDLASIGCDKTQGDDTCQVAGSEDGATVWLHPMSKRYMYRYEVEKNLLYREPLVKTFELDLESKDLFNRYSTSEEGNTYWHSNYLYEEYKDEQGLHKAYIYLEALPRNISDTTDYKLMLRNLACVWDDMILMLFEDDSVIPDNADIPSDAQEVKDDMDTPHNTDIPEEIQHKRFQDNQADGATADADGFPYNYHGNVVDVEIIYDKPCNYTRISDAFGERVHPITGEVRTHDGIDFAAAAGTDIWAAADGVVYGTDYSSEYGNYVVLLHANGDMTYYCHCKEVTVRKDDRVKRGDKIAIVGKTGQATGSFLHFALSKDGAFVNPQNYMEDT